MSHLFCIAFYMLGAGKFAVVAVVAKDSNAFFVNGHMLQEKGGGTSLSCTQSNLPIIKLEKD